MQREQPSPLSVRFLIGYSFIALPLAFAGLPLYIHAPDFYTRDLGMSLGLIGAILLFVRLFDAVQDPVIGHLSDKYNTKRIQILWGGVIAMMTGMGALFYGPQFGAPIALWFATSIILATTGFSILTININMIGSFWSNDPAQRTTISGWREGFGLAGLLIASILPAALMPVYGADVSFEILFLSFAVMMAGAFFIFARLLKAMPPTKALSPHNAAPFAFFRILIGENKHFFIVCFLTHLAAAFPGALVLFFIRDYLDAEARTGLFLLLYFLSGAALMAVWVKAAKHIGKERAWLASMILAIATFIWAFFLQPGDIWQFAIVCVLSGMALGADLALPPSILADRVSAQKDEANATQYYAALAFIPKLALALASGSAFLLLDHFAFQASAENSDAALQTLILLYALIPCLIKAGAAGYLYLICLMKGKAYVD